MKKRVFAFLALLTLAIPAICSATPPRMGPYLSGFAGVALTTDTDATGFDLDDRVEFDPGVNIGGTGGFDYGFMRLEGEISYKQGEIDRVVDRLRADRFRDIDGGVGALAFMGNILVDMHNQSPITPYIGGGVGVAVVYQDDTYGTSEIDGARIRLYSSDEDAVFAFQVGAGLEIALTRILSLDLNYRYFRTTEASFIDNDLRFESHNAAAGLRVSF